MNIFSLVGLNDIGTLFILWCILGVLSLVFMFVLKIGNERVLGCFAWIFGVPLTVLWFLVTVQIVILLFTAVVINPLSTVFGA